MKTRRSRKGARSENKIKKEDRKQARKRNCADITRKGVLIWSWRETIRALQFVFMRIADVFRFTRYLSYVLIQGLHPSMVTFEDQLSHSGVTRLSHVESPFKCGGELQPSFPSQYRFQGSDASQPNQSRDSLRR